MTYVRLGHERLRDVLTLCDECHENFHKTWKYAEYYKEQDYEHWETYSLDDTAKLCAMYLSKDYWFGGELNCNDLNTCRDLIDDYFRDTEKTEPALINPEDILLYFRNKRYEVLFKAEREIEGFILDKKINKAIDSFLDSRFGTKGGKGGNENRAKARAYTLRHSHESFHRNYWYLWHINILIEEAKKYE